jgi:hypothetical protein
MRRFGLIVALALVAVVSLSTVGIAHAAPRHDKAVFRKRFMVRSDGRYYGKWMDTGSVWTSSGHRCWGELWFANDGSGRFKVIEELTTADGAYAVIGSGRAYVTATTVVFSFNASKSGLFRRVMKRITNGKKYYYRYKAVTPDGWQSTLRLFKTPRTFYRDFRLGVWG